MKNLSIISFSFLLSLVQASAQEAPDRQLEFTTAESNGRVVFTPVMPPLIQKPGAPKAYWTYFWEFGDGSYSEEENPAHVYARAGDYYASLDATAHYDDGKKARKKKKPVHAGEMSTATAGITTLNPFDPKLHQMVALYAYTKPKAEEELTLVLGYRNLGVVPTDGRLHLFFNEKKYPAEHFSFLEARTHYGELPDAGTSDAFPVDSSPMFDWAALPLHSGSGVSTLLQPEAGNSVIVEEMLANARGTYRQEEAWHFTELQPNEKRNMFVSLACTPNMLRDTNAIIHLEAVFAPFDPAVAPEHYVYEIEIVGSHDPNGIFVSDNKVNFRLIGSKKLNYKIQFQNNGEGPASKVEVKVEVPKGLKTGAMRVESWYPKCPICPKEPTTKGCLDTATVADGLVFTFRNIYLPGTHQKDVDHRDSTKGFVRYSLGADKDMPKLPFKSRARIVFDKNTPIYTNYTRTRFKIGLSPGIKAGYAFHPDSIQNGYAFLGLSLSPFKSWRYYPQVELLTGLRGRKDETAGESHQLLETFLNVMPEIPQQDSSIADTIFHINRGLVTLEIPVQIRKNFNRFFGAGLGASAIMTFENGDRQLEVGRHVIDWQGESNAAGTITAVRKEDPPAYNLKEPEHFQAAHTRFAVFADLTFGSVRLGPNLGIRAGYLLGPAHYRKPFVQFSAEVKL